MSNSKEINKYVVMIMIFMILSTWIIMWKVVIAELEISEGNVFESVATYAVNRNIRNKWVN
jgi:hypothetical protein